MAKAPKAPATEEEAATEAAAALAAQLAALRAELTATTSAAGQAAIAERNSLKAQIAAAKSPESGAVKASREEARAYEYTYQIKQRYLRQQEKDEARAANMRQKGAYAKKTSGGPDLSKGIAEAAQMQKRARGASDAVSGIGKGGSGKPIETVEAGNKGLKLLAKNLGISKAQLRAPLVAGAIELSKLAMGVRGMAQLSAIEARAGFQLRQLFKGIDPMPVVRAADRLSQVFNKTSVTGKALEGIFGRAFGYIFGKIEALAPYAHTAFQGMVLAALLLENGWLRASIALQPLTDAIGEFLPAGDDMQTAAWLGGAAFVALGYAAASAAIPVLAVAAAFKAVSEAVEQATKLYREWDDRSGTLITQSEAGFSGAASKSGEDRIAAQAAANYEKNKARDEAEARAGQATGQAYTDGLAGGLGTGAPKVAAAAGAVAGVIDPKVRDVTKTHSPSRMAWKTGQEQPAGLVGGMRSGIPDVEAAAADMGGASNAGTRAGASGGGSKASASGGDLPPLHFHFPNVTSAPAASDIRAVISTVFREEMRAILQGLGRPVNA